MLSIMPSSAIKLMSKLNMQSEQNKQNRTDESAGVQSNPADLVLALKPLCGPVCVTGAMPACKAASGLTKELLRRIRTAVVLK